MKGFVRACFVLLFVFLGGGQIFASAVAIVCEEVTLEVTDRGHYERPIDSCKGLKDCEQRPDGSFYHKVPFSRCQVLDSQGGAQCPPKRSLVRISEDIPVDRFKGRLTAWNSMGPNGPVSGQGLDQLHALYGDPLSGKLGQADVSVEQVVHCAGKGQTIGSGFDGICCEGLTQAGVFNLSICDQLVGGYVCIACGDGKCEGPSENHCSCPGDCINNKVSL